MRDVTPESSSILKEIFSHLKKFAVHPVEEIRHLPNWNWPRVFTLQIVLSLISGILSAVARTEFSTWKLLQAVIFFPFVSTLTGLILASFFYYYFQVFEKRTVSFIKLTIVVFLSNTVFYLFHSIAGLLVFFDILGMLFTGVLLVVGLNENFQMPKKNAIRLVGILLILIFSVWIAEKLHNPQLSSNANSSLRDTTL